MRRCYKVLALCVLGAVAALFPSLFHRREKFHKQQLLEIGTPEEAAIAKEWRGRVYLASYPRSGNHWVRHLVEEATGIATSSTYVDPDPQHLTAAFPWGGFCCDHGYEGHCRYPQPGETALIKTHFPAMHTSWFDQLPCRFSIRIIRHPVDCFYSLYLWEKAQGHKRAEPFIPRKRLKNYIRNWRRFQTYWDSQENVLTLRYEDLIKNPLPSLNLLLEKMGYPVDRNDLERALAKYPAEEKLFKYLSHYTPEDLELIQNKLGGLMKKYGYKL